MSSRNPYEPSSVECDVQAVHRRRWTPSLRSLLVVYTLVGFAMLSAMIGVGQNYQAQRPWGSDNALLGIGGFLSVLSLLTYCMCPFIFLSGGSAGQQRRLWPAPLLALVLLVVLLSLPAVRTAA